MVGESNKQEDGFEMYKNKRNSTTPDEILNQEVLNACRLAEALHRQLFWVRLSLPYLILAVILLFIFLLSILFAHYLIPVEFVNSNVLIIFCTVGTYVRNFPWSELNEIV